jgi:peptidoglycan/xylan/chitin deacetylase (PgdA/CDA1 family)
MTGRFILSLDCEGKWGVADHLGPVEHRALGDASLREAYSSVVGLLDEFDIPATFSFVGLFGESPGSFRRLRPAIEQLAARAGDHLQPALDDLDHGSREGWHGDWAVEMAGAAKTHHEIALHGVTHFPWDRMDDAFVAQEMALYRELESPVGRSLTMVFPRNRLAHADLLPSIGIEGYRLARKRRSRLQSLAAEFNIFERGEPDASAPDRRPVPIPAGYFVNWQNGLRRLVPKAVSKRRFANILADAETMEGVCHFWLHPENIASAPATLELLRGMIRQIARARDAGRCIVQTQIDYCRQRKPAARAGVG